MNRELKRKLFLNNYINFHDYFPMIMADQPIAVITNEGVDNEGQGCNVFPSIASFSSGLICILPFENILLISKFHENNF